MTIPLLALAVPSLLGGFWGIEALYGRHFGATEAAPISGWIAQLLAPFSHAPVAALASLGAVVAGAALAWPIYARAQRDPLPAKLGALAQAMRDRFYFDELYERIIAWTQESLATLANAIDQWVIAGFLVRGAHGTTEFLGRALAPGANRQLADLRLLFRDGRGGGAALHAWPSLNPISMSILTFILGCPLLAARCWWR